MSVIHMKARIEMISKEVFYLANVKDSFNQVHFLSIIEGQTVGGPALGSFKML